MNNIKNVVDEKQMEEILGYYLANKEKIDNAMNEGQFPSNERVGYNNGLSDEGRGYNGALYEALVNAGVDEKKMIAAGMGRRASGQPRLRDGSGQGIGNNLARIPK